MESGTASSQGPWDAYLAWDDGGTWAPVPDISVEEYAGGLPATQAPSFAWDGNVPAFAVSSQVWGFVNRNALQQPPPNPPPNMNNSYKAARARRITPFAETSSSRPVRRLSPDSMQSLNSSTLSHRTSLDRSPPRGPERYPQANNPRKSSKSHSNSSLEADDHSNSSHSHEQSAMSGKKRPLPATESVEDGPGGPKIAKRSKKVAHNTVEQRYRMNINSKIAELRESIPSLRSTKANLSDDEENGGNNAPTRGLPKAKVLSKANEYILELEREARQLRNENEALEQKKALLRTVAASEEPDASPEFSPRVLLQSFLSLNLLSVVLLKASDLQSIQPAKTLPMNQRSGKGNFVEKALMGCLMVFEGMHDQSQGSNTHQGLNAITI